MESLGQKNAGDWATYSSYIEDKKNQEDDPDMGWVEERQRKELRKQMAAVSSQESSKCKGRRKENVLEDWPGIGVFARLSREPGGEKALVVTTENET